MVARVGYRTAARAHFRTRCDPLLCLLPRSSSALPARALDHTQLAVVINTLDPLSVRIGEYYAGRRRIAFQNIIKVSFPPHANALTSEEFDAVKAQLDRQTGPNVQAYALTWANPYRVACMSITAAYLWF